jgi:DNA-directed RNA polymerase subunit omega
MLSKPMMVTSGPRLPNFRFFTICSIFSTIKPQNSIKSGFAKSVNYLLLKSAKPLQSSALFRLEIVNAELCKKAAEKVGNPNVLVNLISRRVRQLNSGGGGLSRPLVANATNLGVGDIALREILEDKIGWELPEPVELVRPQAKKRRKR